VVQTSGYGCARKGQAFRDRPVAPWDRIRDPDSNRIIDDRILREEFFMILPTIIL